MANIANFVPIDELRNYIHPPLHNGIKVTTHIINESNDIISYMDPIYGPMVVNPKSHIPANAHSFMIITSITCATSFDLLGFYDLNPEFKRVLTQDAHRIDGPHEYTYIFGIRVNVYGMRPGSLFRDPVTGIIYAVGHVNWAEIVRDHVIEYANDRRYSDIQGIEYVSEDPNAAIYLAGSMRVKRIPSVPAVYKRKPSGVYITRMSESGSLEVIKNSDTSLCREKSNVPIFDTIKEAEDYIHQRQSVDTAPSRAKKGSTSTSIPKLSPTDSLRKRLEVYDSIREEKKAKRATERAKNPRPSIPNNHDLAEPYGVTRRASESVFLRFMQFAFGYIAKLTHTAGWGKWVSF